MREWIKSLYRAANSSRERSWKFILNSKFLIDKDTSRYNCTTLWKNCLQTKKHLSSSSPGGYSHVLWFSFFLFFFLEHMVISCTSAITQTKVEHMWRLLAGSYFPTRRREEEEEKKEKKGKSKSWEISRHPSRGGCHFSSLALFLTLFSSYCSRGVIFLFPLQTR